MTEITTQSGAEVVINSAPFKDAMALKNAFERELAKTDIKLDKLDLKSDITAISSIIFAIDSSDKIFEAVFKCLSRCTYDGVKITESIFEPEEARGDYYEIVIECVKVNLAPFFKGLSSRLKSLGKPSPAEDPKQV